MTENRIITEEEAKPKSYMTFLDEPGTFTHMAAVDMQKRTHYENSILRSEKSIKDMFEAVTSGRTAYAIVPIENSSDGRVKHTHEGLVEYDVQIVDEGVLPVIQTAYAQDFTKVEKWASKKSALWQCPSHIEGQMDRKIEDIDLIETNSTTEAVRMAADDSTIAAIASGIAADELGVSNKLQRIDHFNDKDSNATTFAVIQKRGELSQPTGNDKTTFIMTIDDTKGKLIEALDVLAEKGVDLNKIKSTSKKDGKVSFLVSGNGHELDDKMGPALSALEEAGIGVKRLGSYPKADYIPPETEETYDFNAAIKRIEDEAKNGEAMDENKRIIVFTLIDQPGGLRNALNPFAEKGVNLTAIDSQPSGLHDQHIFYLAFDKTTDGGDELIDKLTTYCTHVMELQRA
jgi:chorismate mutase / prephenate dehydratase